mmetsp:Transcript_15290/g.53750  ORF Transcript_15290/g.53750 Transcript_15290/m.53750 type:complete len:205 (-) Transcript_15290:21-635(-)
MGRTALLSSRLVGCSLLRSGLLNSSLIEGKLLLIDRLLIDDLLLLLGGKVKWHASPAACVALAAALAHGESLEGLSARLLAGVAMLARVVIRHLHARRKVLLHVPLRHNAAALLLGLLVRLHRQADLLRRCSISRLGRLSCGRGLLGCHPPCISFFSASTFFAAAFSATACCATAWAVPPFSAADLSAAAFSAAASNENDWDAW